MRRCLGGVVAERVEVDQFEAALGLGGCLVVELLPGLAGTHHLPVRRVVAAFPQTARSAGMSTPMRTSVTFMLIRSRMRSRVSWSSSRCIFSRVMSSSMKTRRAVCVQGGHGRCGSAPRRVMRVRGAVEVQDRLAGGFRLGGDRGLDVGDGTWRSRVPGIAFGLSPGCRASQESSNAAAISQAVSVLPW